METLQKVEGESQRSGVEGRIEDQFEVRVEFLGIEET